MTFYIYCVKNNLNNLMYIGKTNNPELRWKKHIYASSGKNKKLFQGLQMAIKKYGVENFTFSIVEELPNEEQAYQAEIKWIAYYDSYKNGYNRTPGGEGNPSGEDHYFYGKHHSNETRKKMSEKQAGSSNPNFGKHHSEETKQKMREKKIGKYVGENHPLAKFTNDEIIKIRELALTYSNSQIAKMYNVSTSKIYKIVSGQIYKKVNNGKR